MEAIERQNQGNLQLRQQEGQIVLQKMQGEMQKEQAKIAASHQGDMELHNMDNEARLKETILKLQQDVEALKQGGNYAR
jgi:hypothetical protein